MKRKVWGFIFGFLGLWVVSLYVTAAEVNYADPAMGAQVTTVSEHPVYPAQKAIDGDTGATGFASSWVPMMGAYQKPWLVIDLGQPRLVKRVKVYMQNPPPGPKKPTAFTIEGWLGKEWETLTVVTGNQDPTFTFTLTVEMVIEKVRITITQVTTGVNDWPFLNEVEVWGSVNQYLPLRQWLTTGTFNGRSFAEEVLEPASTWPVEELEVAGQSWARLPMNPDGSFRIPDATGAGGIGYAHIYFYVSQNSNFQLRVGSETSLKLYLNGIPVYNYTGTRPLIPGEDQVSVVLNQGWNRLLLKSENTGTVGAFVIGLATPESAIPMNTITFNLDDPIHLYLLNAQAEPSVFSPEGWRQKTIINLKATRDCLLTVRVFREGETTPVVTLLSDRLYKAGNISVEWDGKDAAGHYVGDGEYLIRLSAVDFTNPAVSVEVEPVAVEMKVARMASPLLVLPLAGAKLTTARPFFRWEAVPGAEEYLLQYAPSPDFRQGVTEITLTGTEYLPENLTVGTWYWRVLALDRYGNAGYSRTGQFTITASSATDYQLASGIFHLKVGPNPFSPNGDGLRDEAYISFVSGATSRVSVQVYDLEGKLIRTLLREDQISPQATDYLLVWNGLNEKGQRVAPGIYLVVVQGRDNLNEQQTTQRIPLLLVR